MGERPRPPPPRPTPGPPPPRRAGVRIVPLGEWAGAAAGKRGPGGAGGGGGGSWASVGQAPGGVWTCHWYVSGLPVVPPVALMVNVAEPVGQTACGAGWTVMTG